VECFSGFLEMCEDSSKYACLFEHHPACSEMTHQYIGFALSMAVMKIENTSELLS